MKLQGKVAIITGASKGIGKGIAVRFAEEGAAVVLASRSRGLLEALAADIQKKGGKALALEFDEEFGWLGNDSVHNARSCEG